jgi:hypothetical protein
MSGEWQCLLCSSEIEGDENPRLHGWHYFDEYGWQCSDCRGRCMRCGKRKPGIHTCTPGTQAAPNTSGSLPYPTENATTKATQTP